MRRGSSWSRGASSREIRRWIYASGKATGLEWLDMAKKNDNQEKPAEGVLVAAAKKLGKAAGKVAAVAGAGADAPAEEAAPPAPKPQTKSVKVPKLAKKDKSRLPRKEKKAQQKAANRK